VGGPVAVTTRRLRWGGRAAGAGLAAGLALLVGPSVALGHQLGGAFESPIPLSVYLVGAAAAVGLSFTFIFRRDVPPFPPGETRTRRVPGWLRLALRAAGVLAVAWVVAQGIVGGNSEGDVTRLFLWTYGWVGLALVSALVGPAWSWIDPFTTIHDVGAAALRLVGVRGWAPAPYPAWLGRWPAVLGFGFFVWLELVVTGGGGGRPLVVAFVVYTIVTQVGMLQYGRDAWRANGETFTVWFRALGRIAPFALAGSPEAGLVRRRPFGAGLLEPGWSAALVALVAVGVASVLYDGLSQTQAWFDVVGLPGLPGSTLVLTLFLAGAAGLALGVSRLVGRPPIERAAGLAALGAGLAPIATGYITGHYLTSLVVDGQRIVIAISDPFQQGWDLFGTAFFQPSNRLLAPGVVWAVQLAAVVGGHMLGALAGHLAAVSGRRAGDIPPAELRALRLRQVPLAVLMVALTVATLWSLGQNIVVAAPAAP
jgi:hypothetical protein